MEELKQSIDDLSDLVAKQSEHLTQLQQSQQQLQQQWSTVEGGFATRVATLEDRFNQTWVLPPRPKQRPGKAVIRTSDNSATETDRGAASDQANAGRFSNIGDQCRPLPGRSRVRQANTGVESDLEADEPDNHLRREQLLASVLETRRRRRPTQAARVNQEGEHSEPPPLPRRDSRQRDRDLREAHPLQRQLPRAIHDAVHGRQPKARHYRIGFQEDDLDYFDYLHQRNPSGSIDNFNPAYGYIDQNLPHPTWVHDHSDFEEVDYPRNSGRRVPAPVRDHDRGLKLRVDPPKFSGNDLHTWLFQVEQYFN